MQRPLNNETEERFLSDIIGKHAPRRSNTEAKSIFNAIQAAFTAGRERWDGSCIADPEMISHLAACACVALEYDEGKEIPWDTGEHDYVLLRTLRYFMSTLREAILEDRIWQNSDGGWNHGCFRIPTWYVEHCKEVQREHDEHVRKVRERYR